MPAVIIKNRIKAVLDRRNVTHRTVIVTEKAPKQLRITLKCPVEAIDLAGVINTSRLGLKATTDLAKQKRMFVHTWTRNHQQRKFGWPLW